MAATIEVNKQSVKTFMETGKDQPFVIPEYQRPYEWDEDQVQTLFDDLWDFTANVSENKDEKSTYFLGCIVSFENNGTQEIIDGQQRITSLFLLMRAIYTKLDSSTDKNDTIKNFINKIEPTLWREDKYTGAVNKDDILIESRVLDNEGNDILRKILKTGEANPDAQDNYSKNYIQFQKLFAEYSEENSLMIYDFILTVLNRAIVFPITADSQDTALTIFSTLNDRGLPLSDADIFKAKIYNHLDSKNKSDFIESWRELDQDATAVGESIQQLFYYYMFYLKALDHDYSTTIPGIRKFYAPDDKNSRLFANDLMDNLNCVLNIWKVVNVHEELEEETWSKNLKILQALDILTSYPNEFWKYPVVIYYLVHHKEDNFESEFALFLNKLLITLLTRYLMVPTVNAVRSDIIKLNIAIVESSRPRFEFKEIDKSQLESKIKNPPRNAVRMLLKILAYQEQDELLPGKWEIEHIFPQKWQSTYFVNIPEDTVKERIEHLGNKLPFEKKLNIIAGNGYFDKKKAEYAKSNITITKKMADVDSSEWDLDSITERDVRVSDAILSILKKWDDDYNNIISEHSSMRPTPEEKELIEKFKKNGWV